MTENKCRTIREIHEFLRRRSFKFFLQKVFKILNPSSKLLWNWHIDYICSAMEEIACGNIKRLIINIPPRYLKSIICSVAFPAWMLGRMPDKRIIVASYSRQLAAKHSIDCRNIMQSPWYKKNFPYVRIPKGSNEKYKFCTTRNGFRFATSTGGTLTGEGGDILIADDPQNPVHIYKKANRTKAIKWFDGVFSSRLNNKNEGTILVIMQRLHVDDLSAHLLKTDIWSHVCLPAINDCHQFFLMRGEIVYIRKTGTILHEKMENETTLDNVRKELGDHNYMAQYQQEPVELEGNMIMPAWLKYFDISELRAKGVLTYYISIDCASGIGTENDFTAIAVFTILGENFYLCEMLQLKLAYPELKKEVENVIRKYAPLAVLIEDKSNGASMIQDLGTEHNNIIAIKPTHSKEFRVNEILVFIEAGHLWIAREQPWTEPLVDELLAFPGGKHDDQVDTISQFVNWYNKNKKYTKFEFKIRSL